MKKFVIAIVGAAVIVAVGWFLMSHAFHRAPTVSFTGYDDSSNGVVVARFVMTIPVSRPYVWLQRPESSVVTNGSVSVGTLTHSGKMIFSVPVRQTGEAWHLTLSLWEGGDVSKLKELLHHKPDVVINLMVPPK
jgi:hypothetical protein